MVLSMFNVGNIWICHGDLEFTQEGLEFCWQHYSNNISSVICDNVHRFSVYTPSTIVFWIKSSRDGQRMVLFHANWILKLNFAEENITCLTYSTPFYKTNFGGHLILPTGRFGMLPKLRVGKLPTLFFWGVESCRQLRGLERQIL